VNAWNTPFGAFGARQEVVASLLAVFCGIADDMVGNRQGAMRHRHCGFFHPAVMGNPVEYCRQKAVLHASVTLPAKAKRNRAFRDWSKLSDRDRQAYWRWRHQHQEAY
jgi:hypothetical protein